MDISNIILWNNCYILIGGKTVFNKGLVDKGIVRIGDLIAENNEIITSKLRELNLSPLDAFQLFSVIDALPKDWRHALKSYGYDRRHYSTLLHQGVTDDQKSPKIHK